MCHERRKSLQRRMLAGWIVGGLVGVFVNLAVADGRGAKAPFQMSPDGKPEQLTGHLKYPDPTWVAFDGKNRPYLLHTRKEETSGYVSTLRSGKWVRRSFAQVIRKKYPEFQSFTCGPLDKSGQLDRHAFGRLTFDNSDALYMVVYFVTKTRPAFTTLIGVPRRAALLFSTDYGKSFKVYDMPGYKAMLEVWQFHADHSAPPVIGILKAKDRKATFFDFDIIIPRKTGDGLSFSKPIRVTENANYILDQNGGNEFAVTKGNMTYVVFPEVPPVDVDNAGQIRRIVRGNPTSVATIDRKRERVVSKKYLVNATPGRSDNHSTPVITIDGNGHLHVVSGSHNNNLFHLRASKPKTIACDWSKPVVCAIGTYMTLCCGKQDMLHIAYRTSHSHGNRLRQFMQRNATASGQWSEKKELVLPPRGQRGGRGYRSFNHRIFSDRVGTLYLSVSFTGAPLGKHDGKRWHDEYPRILISSVDRGKTWLQATTAALARRISTKKTTTTKKPATDGLPAGSDESAATGDPSDVVYFPLNAVRWLTPPRKIAALVTETGTDRFEAKLFHFGQQDRAMAAELYLLKPGRYGFTLLQDGSAKQPTAAGREFTVTGRRSRVSFTLPATKLCTLRVRRLVEDSRHRLRRRQRLRLCRVAKLPGGNAERRLED